MLSHMVIAAFSILRARGGSSTLVKHLGVRFGVFSAHAEVVPRGPLYWRPGDRILRARGGSSLKSDLLHK